LGNKIPGEDLSLSGTRVMSEINDQSMIAIKSKDTPGTNKISQPYYNLKMYVGRKFWPTTKTYYTMQIADYKTRCLTTALALVSAFSKPLSLEE
jgi:hypothetical protein